MEEVFPRLVLGHKQKRHIRLQTLERRIQKEGYEKWRYYDHTGIVSRTVQARRVKEPEVKYPLIYDPFCQQLFEANTTNTKAHLASQTHRLNMKSYTVNQTALMPVEVTEVDTGDVDDDDLSLKQTQALRLSMAAAQYNGLSASTLAAVLQNPFTVKYLEVLLEAGQNARPSLRMIQEAGTCVMMCVCVCVCVCVCDKRNEKWSAVRV